MEHREYEELLTLYALDALDAPDRRTLEEHLESCSVCRAELGEMRDAAGCWRTLRRPSSRGLKFASVF